MKITFRNGFEMNIKELSKKTFEELYDIHCDLVNGYSHYDDKGEISKLESYIKKRAEQEQLMEVI